jgi:hypothetical protein
VSFESREAEWTDGIVDTLKLIGYRHVTRSEVVNVALSVLRDHLADQSPYEILRFILDRARRRQPFSLGSQR